MTIKELNSNYSQEELSSFPGDNELRYKLFSPLFQNLHENKIIYYEKIIGIVKLKDIVITPERYEATAIPCSVIERGDEIDSYFFKKPEWTFSAIWSWMLLSGESLTVPYAGWSIWCDPEIVKKVEELTLKKKFREALKLTLYEEEE